MSKLNTEMNVSGLSEFKQAMSQGKTAVKTFDAELKLSAAQFKQSGDKEEYLRKRTELLNKQIEEQEKVVKAAQDALAKMAEQGVKENTDAYLKMQEQVAKAQTELVNMQSALTQGTGEMDSAGDAADKLADRLKSIDQKVTFNAVIQGLKAVKDVATSVVSTITSSIKSAWNAMSEAADWADEVATKSAMYNVSEDTYQRMGYASRFVDVDPDTILAAANKLLKLKKEGGVTYLSDDYGMALSGSMLDQVWQVIDALGTLTDEEERAALAQNVFGKSWNNIAPAFGQREYYYELMEKADVVDAERMDKLEELDDAQERLDAAWEAFLLNMAGQFAPMFIEFCDRLIELLKLLEEQMKTEEWQALVQRIMDTILSVFNFIADPEKLNWVLDKFSGVINAIAELLGIDLNGKTTTVDNGVPGPYRIKYKMTEEDTPADMAELFANWDTQKQGEELADDFVSGVEAEAENAYAGGEYVGSNFVAGAVSGANSSGNTTYNNDSTFIETVNITSNSIEGISEQVAKESNRARAGVGS